MYIVRGVLYYPHIYGNENVEGPQGWVSSLISNSSFKEAIAVSLSVTMSRHSTSFWTDVHTSMNRVQCSYFLASAISRYYAFRFLCCSALWNMGSALYHNVILMIFLWKWLQSITHCGKRLIYGSQTFILLPLSVLCDVNTII